MAAWPFDKFGKKMADWVRSPSTEPPEFGIGDAPSPRSRHEPSHEEANVLPVETGKKLYPDVYEPPGEGAGQFATPSKNLFQTSGKKLESSSGSGSAGTSTGKDKGSKPDFGRTTKEDSLRAAGLPQSKGVEINGDWFYAPSAPAFMLGRDGNQARTTSGQAAEGSGEVKAGSVRWTDSNPRQTEVLRTVRSDPPGPTTTEVLRTVRSDASGAGSSQSRPLPAKEGDPFDAATARREEREKARAHYREELARQEREELLTERQKQLIRKRPPPPVREEDEESENVLDALMERIKVQWYPREVWAKLRFEDDYENLWGFNFDVVNRSAKLTLRKARKSWWRASYNVQDMNLVVLTKKLPIPFVGAKMGKHVPAAMQPHLQFGFGYDFSNHTKGFRWALTTPMQSTEGRRGNKEKWNIMNSPVDVGLKWSADVSLPELSGSMGTAEPRLSSDLGNYFFSIDKAYCTFTKRV